MTGVPRHYGEELHALLDGRLADAQRAEVEAHLGECARCRRELEAMRWLKGALASRADEALVPAELTARVRTALDAEDAALRRPPTMTRRTWLAGGLLAAAAVLLFVFLPRHGTSPLPTLVAEDFRAHQSGAVPLAVRSTDPRVVEAYFAREGIAFPTRVFDLGMMQYGLQGGRVHRLDDRPSALFAYEGPDETELVCQMYEGQVSELPPAEETREHNGITFHVHHVDGVTVVFWQEGEVVCVLASDAPRELVIQLAFAKAVPVEPAG